jgi:hypothetical protein
MLLMELGWWVVQGAAQAPYRTRPGRSNGHPTPAGRGAIQHGSHQRQAGVFTGQTADHCDAASPQQAPASMSEPHVRCR